MKFIEQCHKQLVLPVIRDCSKDGPSIDDSQKECTNDRVKQFLDEWQTVECSYESNFNGGNNSTNPVIYDYNGVSHIIPANCTFFNMDIQSVPLAYFDNQYDMVVMDPPWWNKYVRRSRKFNKDNG